MPQNFQLGLGGQHVDQVRGGQFTFASRNGLAISSRLLIESLPKEVQGRVLTGLDRDGAVALAAAALYGSDAVTDHHFDAYVASRARATFERNGLAECSAALTDLPSGPFGLVALPFEARSDSLLARDLLEAAHDALQPGGRLIAATDGGHKWLHEAVQHVFRKADLLLVPDQRGAVILARRLIPEARSKCRRHAITVVHGEETFSITTRPGVFSHGRLDRGSAALLTQAPVLDAGPILDLGCGAGTLGIAVSAPGGEGLVLVDSNARSLALAAENLVANNRGAGQALLRTDLEDLPKLPYTLALANPPYFGGGRIAEAFAATAAANLTDSGLLLMVVKDVARHQPILERCFAAVSVTMVDEYGVFRATIPQRS
ncbi:MAG: hypothetical protein EXS14_09120 [Planctomycetes bacterium]|nr:hypothetical protein [Planctomycetota bacterium]